MIPESDKTKCQAGNTARPAINPTRSQDTDFRRPFVVSRTVFMRHHAEKAEK